LLFFNAVLLEKPVIVICSNLASMTSIVLSVISLLQPLSWQGILMPVLPRSLHGILHAPVPIIAAIPQAPSEEVDGLIFDLEKKKVTFANLDKLPSLPEKAKL
jgi:hypothetical protein